MVMVLAPPEQRDPTGLATVRFFYGLFMDPGQKTVEETAPPWLAF
jgi:hypothetical protein